MSFSPKRQIVCESKTLTVSGNTICNIFHEGIGGINSMVTGGTHTVDDGIGLITTTSGQHSLPIGKYLLDAEVVIEVNSSGKGQSYTFGDISGTIPSLALNQLNSNPSVIRKFTDYTIGSKDYVKTRLSFEFEVTAIDHSNTLSAQYAYTILSVPYQRIVITKID